MLSKRKMMSYNNIKLLTGFEDNSSFVRPENGYVARSRRLRATDPFEGQTKLLLSKKPVYNYFVIYLHLKKIIHSFYLHIHVFNILVRGVRESKQHCCVKMTSISHDFLNQ